MNMDQHGCTPLMIAAESGQLPVIDHLLEKGADLNAQDSVSVDYMQMS